ncbi:MAG: hypothetical protein SFW67_28715 [Myxococcaceae bacterium]|nr:hypothetical protein [Myxococcaceae bacterium]
MKERFPLDRRCVFVWAPHLGRDEALMAAARVHVKPAALTGPLPTLAFASNDAREVDGALTSARSVDVDAWAVSLREVEQLERLRRVELTPSGAELVTQRGPRRLEVGSLVDLRWKAGVERRVQVVLPLLGEGVLVVPAELEVKGPSRQAGELQVLVELQRRAMAVAPERVLVQALSPVQVGATPDVPAELVAVALAEGVRRRAA